MNNLEIMNFEKTKQKSTDKNTNNNRNKFSKANIEEFNSFKYKHFNNFFYNIINDQLTQINNSPNKNDNKADSLIKNEFINKTLNKNLFLNSKTNIKKNKKKQNFMYYDNHNNILFKPKSKEKSENKEKKNYKNYINYKLIDKDNKDIRNNSNLKNQKKIFPYIKPNHINTGQNTIPNIITNKNEKPKNKINSRNISFIQKEDINNSSVNDDYKLYKTSEFNFIYRNKNQQLPKDAINNLLLFLKKNKKHLARTSKYYNIYKEYKKFIEDKELNTNVNESKNKKNNFKNINIGYYGRKPLDGVDIFDITSTYGNQYNNKSEKNRHELIIDELNKLKGYIEKNVNEKELFIKDFLNKHNINCNDKNKLTFFENFIKNFNKKKFYNLLKPYLGIKEMIVNILEEGEKFNINENINDNKKFNNSLSSNNLKSSNLFYVYNKFTPNKTNIYKSPLILKETRNITESNDKNKNLRVLNFSNKDNNNTNNNFYDEVNDHNIRINRITKKKKFDLFDTNSYLKQIEKQSKLHYPNKNYSSNYNLIVEEIGDELEKLTIKIKKEKQFKNIEPIAQKNSNDKPNINNNNFITQTSNKSIEDIFITSNKTFSLSNLSITKKNGEKINSLINNKNNNNRKNKIKIIKNPTKSNFSLDKNIRTNKKKMTQIIINKLNLRPKLNKIEIEDVKKRLKLTEYIVYNNAKRRLMFEELGKNELYECVNNINNNKI